MKVGCFKRCSKCYHAMNSFLVINFCTYCSNVEQNPCTSMVGWGGGGGGGETTRNSISEPGRFS